MEKYIKGFTLFVSVFRALVEFIETVEEVVEGAKRGHSEVKSGAVKFDLVMAALNTTLKKYTDTAEDIIADVKARAATTVKIVVGFYNSIGKFKSSDSE